MKLFAFVAVVALSVAGGCSKATGKAAQGCIDRDAVAQKLVKAVSLLQDARKAVNEERDNAAATGSLREVANLADGVARDLDKLPEAAAEWRGAAALVRGVVDRLQRGDVGTDPSEGIVAAAARIDAASDLTATGPASVFCSPSQVASRVPAATDTQPPGRGIPPLEGSSNLSPFVRDLPDGWRELRWGMTEKEVVAVLRKYVDKKEGTEVGVTAWPDPMPMPTDAGGSRIVQILEHRRPKTIKSIGLWFAKGARTVDAVLYNGRLVAVRASRAYEVPTEIFVKRAIEAYGSEPRQLALQFIDADVPYAAVRTAPAKYSESEQVLFWRSSKTTALMYTMKNLEGGLPAVVLWQEEAIPTVFAALVDFDQQQARAQEAQKKQRDATTQF